VPGVFRTIDPRPRAVIRVSTEVTFWHSAEYGSDFRRNSGEIPRNSAEFRGISPELRKNHFRCQKIPRNSVSAEFRGHPSGEGSIFRKTQYIWIGLFQYNPSTFTTMPYNPDWRAGVPAAGYRRRGRGGIREPLARHDGGHPRPHQHHKQVHTLSLASSMTTRLNVVFYQL
jgi:hypothetical protein